MNSIAVAYIVLSCLLISGLCIESNFHRTEPCARAKGYCVLENECPTSVNLEVKSLCGSQPGAICCPGFPSDQVNCFQTHNACMKQCAKTLKLGQKGCPQGEECCALV